MVAAVGQIVSETILTKKLRSLSKSNRDATEAFDRDYPGDRFHMQCTMN